MKLNFIKILSQARQFYQTRIQPPQGQGLMHNKIMISLREFGQDENTPLRAAWIITDPEGATVEIVTEGELSQLQPAEGDEIIVIVPAQEILLTQAALPKLNSYRLQQALPYALEEKVLDELELLHFAPGPYQTAVKVAGPHEANPGLPVAVIKKAVLEHWLNRLQQNGIRPDVITADLFALPFSENHWQLFIRENQATVRTGLYAGFSSELQNLETLLALKLQEEGQLPEKFIIYQDKNSSFTFHSLALPTDKIVLDKKQELELCASTLNQTAPLNLLQAPYTPTRKLKIPEKNKQAWRLAAYAFSFWLGLLFLSKVGALLILSFEHHHLQSLITGTYQVHFPQAKVVLDPKSRMEGKLKKALAQSEKNRLFQWLGYIAKTSSSLRIQSLSFQNNQLSLELIAPSFSSLDEFILAMKAEGIEIRQQNATMLGNQVKAVLLIEGKSA